MCEVHTFATNAGDGQQVDQKQCGCERFPEVEEQASTWYLLPVLEAEQASIDYWAEVLEAQGSIEMTVVEVPAEEQEGYLP